MPNSKRIIYLSEAQYQELISNGSITVDGNTITYNAYDLYVTPQDTPYIKPVTGIPASDIASGVIPDVPVTDVQINGTSILSSGVANVPVAGTSAFGVAKIDISRGVGIESDGKLRTISAGNSDTRAGANSYLPITPFYQHSSVFYGLAKASGDTTQPSSNNAVGNYTDSAKASIQHMLGTDTIIAPVETEYAYATQAYPVGAIFAMNGKLYNATSAIATTDTIISGTNCAVTSVAEKLANAQGGLEVVRLA